MNQRISLIGLTIRRFRLYIRRAQTVLRAGSADSELGEQRKAFPTRFSSRLQVKFEHLAPNLNLLLTNERIDYHIGYLGGVYGAHVRNFLVFLPAKMSCKLWLNVWTCRSFTCPLTLRNLDRNPTAALISGFIVPRAQRVCIEKGNGDDPRAFLIFLYVFVRLFVSTSA